MQEKAIDNGITSKSIILLTIVLVVLNTFLFSQIGRFSEVLMIITPVLNVVAVNVVAFRWRPYVAALASIAVFMIIPWCINFFTVYNAYSWVNFGMTSVFLMPFAIVLAILFGSIVLFSMNQAPLKKRLAGIALFAFGLIVVFTLQFLILSVCFKPASIFLQQSA